MKKMNKFFIIGLIGGLVAFSAALSMPTQLVQALPDNSVTSSTIKDGEVKTPDIANLAVTKEKLNPDAVKFVAVVRTGGIDIPGHSVGDHVTHCNRGETATGGGFIYGVESPGTHTIVSAVLRSTPTIPPTGWEVIASNNFDSPVRLGVYAVCTHLEVGP